MTSETENIRKASSNTNNSDEEDEFCDAKDEPCLSKQGPVPRQTNEEIVDDLIHKHASLNLGDDKSDNSTLESEEGMFKECDNFIIDEDSQRDYEKTLSDDELIANRDKSDELKLEGNEHFKKQEFKDSIACYTKGLGLCPLNYPKERSLLYGNRAAAHIQLDAKQAAIDDCSKAIEYDPKYMKVLLRRAKLYEDTNKLDESLADYKTIIELDPNHPDARSAIIRLPPLIDARNEQLKEEMMGKLKDLGNLILKPFGLSTNNFQMQKDPNSGSYSINFNQKPS